MEIKKFCQEDIEGAYILETLCYKSPWTKENYMEELKNPYSFNFVLKEKDIVIGFIGSWVVLDDADITKVSILPNLQNKGLGKYILSFMINELIKLNVKQVNLEVRKSNVNAIHLYEKLGFKKIGERKQYYKDKEDALIYVLLLNGGDLNEKIYLGN